MKNIIKQHIAKLKQSKLAQESAYYTLFNIIEKVIPFLLLPVFTRVLTKNDIGYYVLYQAIIEILLPIMTLNIDSSILLNYYKLDKNEFKKYFSTGIILFALFFLVSLIISLLFSPYISNWLSFPIFWLNLVSCIVMFRFFTQLRQHLWRLEYKVKNFGIYTVLISVLKNGLGLYFVFYTNLGWKGLILGHIIGYLMSSIYAFVTFYKGNLIRIHVNQLYIKDFFLVGFPISLHKLGLWLSNAANRVIITSILGTAATGSYGIGAVFGGMVTLIEDAFTKAFIPYLFEKLKNINSENKLEIVRLSYYVYLFLVGVSTIVFIIGYLGVDFIFGAEYSDTKNFILPLVLAAMFKGFYKLHVNYIFFTKKTYKITQITFTTGIFNIGLAYIMILNWGLLGAAYSMLIVSFLQYILTFYVANKMIPMPWRLRK